MFYDVLSTYYVFNHVDDRMRSLWSCLCTNCAFVLWNAHVITAALCVKFFDLLKAFFKIWATHRGDGHMALSPYGNDIGDWEPLCVMITNLQLALYCIVIWLKILVWTSFHQVMLAPCQLYVIYLSLMEMDTKNRNRMQKTQKSNLLILTSGDYCVDSFKIDKLLPICSAWFWSTHKTNGVTNKTLRMLPIMKIRPQLDF